MPMGVENLSEISASKEVDEFLVVERMFSAEPQFPSFGLANIHPVVPDLEGNKSKVVRALQVFRERKVNIAVFPELCLSGYFWDDEDACREYMDQTVLEKQFDWIENEVQPLLDDNLHEVLLNGLVKRSDGQYSNTTMVIRKDQDPRAWQTVYRKIFIPGLEKRFTAPGELNRMVTSGDFGRFGFTTCYDYLFTELTREYAFVDHVDAIFQIASWRAMAMRDYPAMNTRTDLYYGELWNMVMAATSATHQVWTIACNAVGTHEISKVAFWGGSGIWAPSGLKLLQGSNVREELLIVHNVDIKHQRSLEKDDFDYAFDFHQIYRPIEGVPVFSPMD